MRRLSLTLVKLRTKLNHSVCGPSPKERTRAKMTGVLYLGDRKNVLFSMIVQDHEGKRGGRRTNLTEHAPALALLYLHVRGSETPIH